MKRGLWLAIAGIFLTLAASAAAGSRGRGDRIVFVTNHWCTPDNPCRAEIGVVRSNGSGVAVLTRNAIPQAAPVWSPDGSQIAFYRRSRSGQAGQVWTMSPNGRNQRQLTHLSGVQFYGAGLDWAPTGRALVIEAYPSSLGGSTDLWVVNAGTGATTRLTKTPLAEAAPSWSPNGRWITFFSEGRRLPYRIWRLSVATKRVVQLTSGTPLALYPSWSPDSRRIAFTLRGHLAVMNADGSHRHRLGLLGTRPRWSPDGQWLVYVLNGDLFKARPNGSGRTQLTHHGKLTTNDQPDW